MDDKGGCYGFVTGYRNMMRLLNPKRYQAQSGFSLVETLVALGILGVIMIPMLFLSSAFFTGQLLKTRDQLDVGYNSSRFLGRLIEEVQHSERILPGSTTTALYLAYFDPVAQREKWVGYRLVNVSGGRRLERLLYRNGTWDNPISPFATAEATQIFVPGTPTFQYCQDAQDPCVVASPNENALLIRLNDWAFQKTDGDQRLELSTSRPLDIYVGALRSEALVSATAQQLYSFPASNLGPDTDLSLLYLSPSANRLNSFQTGSAGGGGGTLMTILLDADNPGSAYVMTSPNQTIRTMAATAAGRLFLGDDRSPGRTWTWHKDTGLTTLQDNEGRPGTFSMVTGPDGRAFWAEQAGSGSIWSWKDGVLTTLVDNVGGGGGGTQAMAVGPDGRMFAGSWNAANGRLYSWREAGGLLTLIPSSGRTPGVHSLMFAPDGRAFIGSQTEGGHFFTWKDGDLSVLLSGADAPGYQDLQVSPDGRVFFGTRDSSDVGAYYTWKEGEGLSVLVGPYTRTSNRSTCATRDGWFFMLQTKTAGSCDIYNAWKDGVGLITITAPTGQWTCFDACRPSPAEDGRVYLGSGLRFWTWKDDGTANGVLSLILQDAAGSIAYNKTIVGPDGRVFFGQNANPGRFWTWHASTGVSTIIPSGNNTGNNRSSEITPTGRLFFGSVGNAGSARFWTWHPSTGLTTIIPSATTGTSRWGVEVNANGQAFMGENRTNGTVWSWVPDAPTGNIIQAVPTGTASNTSMTVTEVPTGATYTGCAQDQNGTLYCVNGADRTLDRFSPVRPSASEIGFTLAGRLQWGAWASTVGAVAVDSGSDAVALLDVGNSQVDVYNNRNADGLPAAPTSFSVSAQVAQPTGLAYSLRTGRFLVVDSTINANHIKIAIYQPNGTHQKDILVNVSTLVPSAATETNFKLLLDEKRNVVHLLAPTLGRVYALSMPELL